jgi:ABC-type branched-subunit amino acid transport system permease subunit
VRKGSAAWATAVTAAGAFVLLMFAPSAFGPSDMQLLTTWAILAALVYTIDIVFDVLGYLSLVHVGIWGIAAYTVIQLQAKHGFSFGAAAAIACVFSVAAAAVAGAIAFRTQHFYFAILTFIMVSFLVLAETNLKSLTGGGAGAFYFGKSSIFGWALGTRDERFRFCAAVLLFTAAYAFLLRRSRFGKKCRAIGEAQPLAQAVGLQPYRHKLGLFAVSALPLGLIGAGYAVTTSALEPGLFGENIGIAAVLMAIIGGSGTALGPLVGALLYVFVPAKLPFSPSINQALVGVTFILIIRLNPAGVTATLRQGTDCVAARMRRRRARVADTTT